MIRINRNASVWCRRKLILTLVLVYSALPEQSAFAQVDARHAWVSLINLIATPDQYHSKNVSVSGWLTLEFENMSLCLASVVPSSKECVWIELDDAKQKSWRALNGKRVVVLGTFDKTNTGHLGGWSGSLQNIARITSTEVRKPKQ